MGYIILAGAVTAIFFVIFFALRSEINELKFEIKALKFECGQLTGRVERARTTNIYHHGKPAAVGAGRSALISDRSM